jgi:hypothetical protein
MKTVVMLAALTAVGASTPLTAQSRVSVMTGPQSQRPAPGPAQNPPGRPSQGQPSRSNQPPFGWSMTSRLRPLPGRGAFPVRLPGFGFLYVDPYWWAPDGFDPAFPPVAPPPIDVNRPTGGLQLDVDPRRALVYADGWPMGIVESYSGYYQHLDLPAGLHLIELVAPDYEPLAVEVTVTPGRTTTYRGALSRARN